MQNPASSRDLELMAEKEEASYFQSIEKYASHQRGSHSRWVKARWLNTKK